MTVAAPVRQIRERSASQVLSQQLARCCSTEPSRPQQPQVRCNRGVNSSLPAADDKSVLAPIPVTPSPREGSSTPRAVSSKELSTPNKCAKHSGSKRTSSPRRTSVAGRGGYPFAVATLGEDADRQLTGSNPLRKFPSKSCTPSAADAPMRDALPPRYSGMARAASVPVVGKPEPPPELPEEHVDFSANEWSLAVAPARMETMRRHLATLREESDRLQSNIELNQQAQVECEAQLDSNRAKIRELRDEERVLVARQRRQSDAESPEEPELAAQRNLAHMYEQVSKRLASKRAEVDAIARDVSVSAAVLTARCKALRDVRVATRLGRLQHAAKAAVDAERYVRAKRYSQAAEHNAVAQEVAALRSRARELRIEVGSAEGETLALATSRRACAVHSEECMARLRCEIAEEIQAKRLRGVQDASDAELPSRLRQQVANMTTLITEVQSGALHLAERFKDVQRRESSLQDDVEEARRKVLTQSKRKARHVSSCMWLETELLQQRSTTAAWQNSVASLVGTHEDIAAEAASAAQVCRATLRGRMDRPLEEAPPMESAPKQPPVSVATSVASTSCTSDWVMPQRSLGPPHRMAFGCELLA